MKASEKKSAIVNAIESGLKLGQFVAYNQAFGFIANLEIIQAKIDELIECDPDQAASLYEIFIAGCYEKANEIDDSGDHLGMFAGSLFCAWVEARQAAKADPQETIQKFLNWCETDDYGFCYDLEKDIIEVLNKVGLKTFRAVIEEKSLPRIEAVKSDRGTELDYKLRHDIATLKRIYTAQKDISAYLHLCDSAGMDGKDCLTLSSFYVEKSQLETALEWINRGLTLRDRTGGQESGLIPAKRELLKKLGKTNDAVEMSWQQYVNHPHEYTYKDLLNDVPKKEQSERHHKAMAILEKASLENAIDVYVIAKEIDCLADRIKASTRAELEALSHFRTEPAAKALASGQSLKRPPSFMDRVEKRLSQAKGSTVEKSQEHAFHVIPV